MMWQQWQPTWLKITPTPHSVKHAVVFNSQGDGNNILNVICHYLKHKFLSKPSWLDILKHFRYNTAVMKYFTTLNYLAVPTVCDLPLTRDVHCTTVLGWLKNNRRTRVTFCWCTYDCSNKLNSPISRLEEYIKFDFIHWYRIPKMPFKMVLPQSHHGSSVTLVH